MTIIETLQNEHQDVKELYLFHFTKKFGPEKAHKLSALNFTSLKEVYNKVYTLKQCTDELDFIEAHVSNLT